MPVSQYLLEMVYYYPPPTMSPSSIKSVQSTLDQYGMVNINFLPTNAGLGQLFNDTFNIAVTPEGYANWYNSNSVSIDETNTAQHQILSTLYNHLISTNAATNTANLVSSSGWTWVSWATYNSNTFGAGVLGGIGNSFGILPGIGFDVNLASLGGTSQLYALVNTNYNTTPVIDLTLIPWWAYAIVLGGSIILLLSTVLGVFGKGATTISTIQTARKTETERKKVLSEKASSEKESKARISKIRAKTAKTRQETKNLVPKTYDERGFAG